MSFSMASVREPHLPQALHLSCPGWDLAVGTSGGDVRGSAGGPFSGQSKIPDSKLKQTYKSFLTNGNWTPQRRGAELPEYRSESAQSGIFSWNKRLSRYAKAGQYEKTVELFEQMQLEGMNLTSYSFVPVLNACSHLRDLEEGRRIHKHIIRSGCESDVFIGNALIDMYAKCGSLEDAHKVFNSMPVRDVVSWNTMIRGHVKWGKGYMALELSWQMHGEGVEPNPVTFVGVLNACASVAAFEEGQRIHEQIIQSGCLSNVFVASSLVDMYTKCGSVDDAWNVFNKMATRDVVAWTTMIGGYARCGQAHKALELFCQMHREGVEANPVTFVAVLNACANVGLLEEGKHIHEQITQRGWECDVFVGGALVDMYAKFGSIVDAWTVFHNMPVRDVVCWNSMIQGYVNCGKGWKALDLFQQMQCERVKPNLVTFIGALNACALLSALEEGRRVHELITQRDCGLGDIVGSSLIDMYAKCGSIEDALGVFDTLPEPDVIAWTAMIAGYAFHGHAKDAIVLFERMCREGIRLDGVTFVSLLSACSHRGLVDEGLHYFESMSTIHNISPSLDHYALVVDLLGRSGHLQEAEGLINTMSCKPDVTLWMCLLGSCRVHGNLEIGKRAAKQVLVLDPGNSAGCILLSNTYAAAGNLIEWHM